MFICSSQFGKLVIFTFYLKYGCLQNANSLSFWATVAVSELLRWCQLMWGPLHRPHNSAARAAKLMISSLSLSLEESAVSLRWQRTCPVCDCHKWIWAGSRGISLKCINFQHLQWTQWRQELVFFFLNFGLLEQKRMCLQCFAWVYVEMCVCGGNVWGCLRTKIKVWIANTQNILLFTHVQRNDSTFRTKTLENCGRASSSLYFEFFALFSQAALYLQAHRLQINSS